MNYKETNLAGTSWVRCKNLVIENPIAGTMVTRPSSNGIFIETVAAVPKVTFSEEKVIAVDGQQSLVPLIGTCSKEFNATTGSIPLRNPETGELLGTSVTHTELYTILYSLYLQTAMERDAA